MGARTVTSFSDSKFVTRSGYFPARLSKVDSSGSAVSAFTAVWAATAEARAARESSEKCMFVCDSENESV